MTHDDSDYVLDRAITFYRGCVIEQRWKAPRPGYRAQPDTFVWWHEDYDGPEDNRCGAAQTLAEAIENIDWTIGEEA